MFWRARIYEDWGLGYLKSVGGNKKRVAEPSFLCNFQRKEKVSQFKFIRHFFIKTSLADIEIQLREIDSNYDYRSLPEESKKEIDKIDQKYFKEYLTDYVSSSIIITIYLLLFATWLSGYISFVEFEIGEYTIKIFYILLIMLTLNMLVRFDSHDQAKQYMQDLKEIYRRYGGSDDTKR